MGSSVGFRAVVWDMDGTLIDSEPLWEQATYLVSDRMGARLSPAQREKTIGLTFDQTLEQCARNAHIALTKDVANHYKNMAAQFMRDSYAHSTVLFAGTESLMAEFTRRGVPMLIATNTQRAIADSAIDNIGRHWFADTVCGDEVPCGKPEPDIYLEAARRAGVSPQDCLVFEDSLTGMHAASAAGCAVLAVGPLASGTLPPRCWSLKSEFGLDHVEGLTAEALAHWWHQNVLSEIIDDREEF